ncbi:MAG: DUF5106 domain-containing protein [Muribaculaceae bacterium]
MRLTANIFIVIVCNIFTLSGCTQSPAKQKQVIGDATSQKFTVPTVPAVITTQSERAEFVMTHYWDNFNFSDTTLIARAEYTEQAFADFINLLSAVSPQLATQGITTMITRAEVDSKMLAHFMEMAEKYLYEPNSPMRNGEQYIIVLKKIVGSNKLSEIEKVRPQHQLDLALKNRVGHKAIDFTYTTEQGGKRRLYNIKGDKILLFFFRPDCESCKATKKYVQEHGIEKLATIVWVNPDIDAHIDNDYDLRASPTLYLLDSNKTVILKDAMIEQIEHYLMERSQ